MLVELKWEHKSSSSHVFHFHWRQIMNSCIVFDLVWSDHAKSPLAVGPGPVTAQWGVEDQVPSQKIPNAANKYLKACSYHTLAGGFHTALSPGVLKTSSQGCFFFLHDSFFNDKPKVTELFLCKNLDQWRNSFLYILYYIHWDNEAWYLPRTEWAVVISYFPSADFVCIKRRGKYSFSEDLWTRFPLIHMLSMMKYSIWVWNSYLTARPPSAGSYPPIFAKTLMNSTHTFSTKQRLRTRRTSRRKDTL